MTVTITITELTYTHGTSSKFYRVFGYGGNVVTQYGKIGTDGQWTAVKFGDEHKAVTGKIGKGYVQVSRVRVDVDGPVTDDVLRGLATGTADAPVEPALTCEGMGEPTATVTAPMPMLAHEVEGPMHIARLLVDNAWVMQPKLDGDRVLIVAHDGVVKAYGRNGQPKVNNVTEAMLAPFKVFPGGPFVFDGEVVLGTLYLFDLPYSEGIVDHATPFAERYAVLSSLVQALGVKSVQVVPLATTKDEKTDMLVMAQANNREGVIFRDSSAKYSVGRSHSLLKHKFVRTIDCIVTGVSMDGKNSAILSVFNDTGDRIVNIGKASTIGKGLIEVGQVVEVKYLYITDEDAPRLFQPRIVKVRTDKGRAECTTEQLVGAVTNKVW